MYVSLSEVAEFLLAKNKEAKQCERSPVYWRVYKKGIL